ncbi:methyltransferase domain-containing protein [Lysobacter soli]|nr:methyltransferase domain-containing protein [Lysobacter soli]
MKLHIDALDLPSSARVMHFAPERGLSVWLREKFSNYVAGDYDLERYSHIPGMLKVDLCQRDYQLPGPFDLILHSHVIEHLPCNYTAVLLKLHKLLTPGGRHLFSIPVYGRSYEESLASLSHEEATSRFGQFDHVRRFSAADIDRTIGAIFDLPREYRLTDSFSAQVLRAAQIPEDAWQGYTGHSVFSFRREDLII